MAGLSWGGSEELWSRSALWLKQKGHTVSASVKHWPTLNPNVSNLAQKGIRLHIRRSDEATLREQIFGKVLACFDAGSEEKWLQSERTDLVIISQGSASEGRYWMEKCSRNQIPYAVVSQCNAEIWWPDDKKAEHVSTGYRNARRTFFVSRANKALFEDQIGEELTNAEVVWNPVNLSSWEPVSWPEESEFFSMASVARLDPAAKGQDVLFRALSSEKWRNRKLRVNLYGYGPCRKSHEKLKGHYNLSAVRFCDHVSDIRQVWAENHLLILPSRYEGLPLALVEAILCGRTAVATCAGGNAELIEDNSTGFLCSAARPEVLDDAMERAWNSRSRWQEMALAARQSLVRKMPTDPVAVFSEKLISLAS